MAMKRERERERRKLSTRGEVRERECIFRCGEMGRERESLCTWKQRIIDTCRTVSLYIYLLLFIYQHLHHQHNKGYELYLDYLNLTI